MSKAIISPIVGSCPSCEGRHVVEHTEKCWDCRGTGRKSKRVKKKCKACNATGTYVRKISKHNHSVKPCIKCEGKGHKVVWVKTSSACDTCEGTGKFFKKRRCTTCKGKGKTTINGMGSFFPTDIKKKLQLT